MAAAVKSSALAALFAELQKITSETLVSSAACLLRRRPLEGRAGSVLMFRPSPAESAAAAAHRARFDQWSAAAAVLLRESSTVGSRFEDTARQFARLVSLEWRDDPTIPSPRSRIAFRERVQALSSELEGMLAAANPFVSLRQSQTPLSYETLLLRVEAGADHWRINGSWQDKKASEIVAVPITPDRLQKIRTQDLDAKWGQEARALAQNIESLAELGETLFRHVLSASLSALYDEARTDALRRGRALRLEFAMAGDGSLWSVPWELLHDGVRFLALADDLSITRRIEGPRRAPGVGPGAKPLRLLMTVSSPSTLTAIDQSERISALQAAVTPLVLNGSLQLDVAPDGCVKTLRRFLVAARRQGRPYDVWHFAGHGTVDDLGRGRLAMTSQSGSVHWMGGAEMASLFAESSQIRLAVLNACRGAEGDLQKHWPSPAAALILCGIPAVVAMQLAISYEASLAFDRELYAQLVDEATIDEAVIGARRAILDLPNHVEWLRPVLFTGGEEAVSVDFRP